MSISATSNYMSNSDILGWMETKTDGLYGQMRDEMDGADANADAEAALDKIQGDIANAKTNGGDAAAIHDEVNAALQKYAGNAEVVAVLQPIADQLNGEYKTSAPENGPAAAGTTPSTPGTPPTAAGATALHVDPLIGNNGRPPQSSLVFGTPDTPRTVKITDAEVDSWTKNIDNTLETLGKKDQLSLIDIQEVNSELNQAKQTASALIDAADKSATDIIEHIS